MGPGGFSSPDTGPQGPGPLWGKGVAPGPSRLGLCKARAWFLSSFVPWAEYSQRQHPSPLFCSSKNATPRRGQDLCPTEWAQVPCSALSPQSSPGPLRSCSLLFLLCPKLGQSCTLGGLEELGSKLSLLLALGGLQGGGPSHSLGLRCPFRELPPGHFPLRRTEGRRETEAQSGEWLDPSPLGLAEDSDPQSHQGSPQGPSMGAGRPRSFCPKSWVGLGLGLCKFLQTPGPYLQVLP